MTLSLFLIQRYLSNFIKVLLTLTLIIITIDFFENFRRMSDTDAPFSNAVVISFLGTPVFISQALPLIILLSGLSFAISLNRSSEIVIIRANGRSALQAMLAPLICTFFIGVFAVQFFDPYVHNLREDFSTTAAELSGRGTLSISVNDRGYWLRQQSEHSSQIIKAEETLQNGNVLRAITVFDFDEDDRLIRRLSAPIAFLRSNQWVIINPKIWDVQKMLEDPSGAKSIKSVLNLPTTITPGQILDGFPKPQTLTPAQLDQQIATLNQSGFSTLAYRIERISQLSRPIFLMALFLLGSIFVLRIVRWRGVGMAILLSVSLGFSLFFLHNFGKSLGLAGEIPLLISTLAPVALSVLLAIGLFLHFEDG